MYSTSRPTSAPLPCSSGLDNSLPGRTKISSGLLCTDYQESNNNQQMGSCQSTEAASRALDPTPMKAKTVVPKPADAKTASTRGLTPTANTDPADASHQSLDESVKSFGSSHSFRSDGKSKSGPRSVGDASSVGSVGADSTSRNKGLKSSSSVLGLDSMIESRREEGTLQRNMVHMEVPFGKPIEEVYDGVHTGPVLGSGISGLVRLVTHKATGVKYAVKCLDLGLVDTAEGLAQLREEIFIMCQLDHPNIVRLEEVYESHSEIYLVQELCLGGELFDRLDEQPDYHYTEAECARLVKEMLCAVRYLHSKGIIHRDLKLENFLFSSTAQDSELKMIDFGLSKHFRYGEVQHDAVGTPYTVAPEVIRGSYDERCDIWAIGVISFLLLSGEPPFGGCGGPEPLMTVRSNILACKYEFEPAEVWDLVSPGARDFIRSLLVLDPQNRPTAQEAQNLPWLKEWADRARSEGDNILNPNVVKALVNFKEFSDMRKLLCEVLSFTLLPDQIKDLRKEFEKMDTDGSGEISLSALKEVLVTNAGAGSLGALTEEEVEDIFNAMRVKKSETTIHWHEFIAAGLSQCQVDDRNLRLAFDRLDSDHKGYVTLDDIMDLMGNDSHHSEDMMREMWGDSMKAVNCSHALITYSDFLLLMKGQTRDTNESGETGWRANRDKLDISQLHVVVEEIDEENQQESTRKAATGEGDNGLSVATASPSLSTENSSWHGPDDAAFIARKRTLEHTNSDPDVFLIPTGDRLPPLHTIPKPEPYIRKRSRSFDEMEHAKACEDPSLRMFSTDARRAVALPEHDPNQMESIMSDRMKSALQHNRQLYRAHRQMRLSVMEASKRFEEQQARRARSILLAQQAESDVLNKGQAGLVMRRVQNMTVSTEEVRQLLEQNKKEQQSLMEKANRRGGRGRRTRKKTISDIGDMLGSLTQDEMTKIAVEAETPISGESVAVVPSVIETTVPKPVETNPRGATVPGEFRKVNDPFGAHGKYYYLS